jgi:hypothetical protein
MMRSPIEDSGTKVVVVEIGKVRVSGGVGSDEGEGAGSVRGEVEGDEGWKMIVESAGQAGRLSLKPFVVVSWSPRPRIATISSAKAGQSDSQSCATGGELDQLKATCYVDNSTANYLPLSTVPALAFTQPRMISPTASLGQPCPCQSSPDRISRQIFRLIQLMTTRRSLRLPVLPA